MMEMKGRYRGKREKEKASMRGECKRKAERRKQETQKRRKEREMTQSKIHKLHTRLQIKAHAHTQKEIKHKKRQ